MLGINHSTSYDEFRAYAKIAIDRKEGRVPIVSRVPADHTTPSAVYDSFRRNGLGSVDHTTYPDPLALLESVPQGQHVDRWSIVAGDPFLEFIVRDGKSFARELAVPPGWHAAETTQTDDPVGHLRLALQKHAAIKIPGVPNIPTAIGYVGFEAKRLVEPTILQPAADPLAMPDTWLFFFRQFVIFDHATQSAYLVVTKAMSEIAAGDSRQFADAQMRIDRLDSHLRRALQPLRPLKECAGSITTNRSADEYHKAVERVQELIAEGDLMQLVYSQRFRASYTGSSFDFYRHLRSRNPSPYMFLIKFGQGVRLVGASPEVLVNIEDGMINLRPIAGTRPRGNNAAEDECFAAELAADPKELVEHRMLVDLARDAASRYSMPGTTEVVRDRVVEYYSTVMHLVSDVRARLRADVPLLDAFFAAFPAGTLSGAPLVRSCRRIVELEGEKRGPYGGAVGFFSPDHIDTGICIRSVLMKGSDAYWQAGGGIVADSTSEGERRESFAKAASIGRVFDPDFDPDTVVAEKKGVE